MKITILGSGSAYGSPMCFNTWGRNQDQQNAKNIRTRPSIMINDLGKNILVDMGPDFRTQINKNNITNIDAVLITHGHYDHIASLPELGRIASILGKQMNVFCSKETLYELKKTCYYMFNENYDTTNQAIGWHEIQHFQKFKVAGLEFEALGVPHHKLETTCFRYKNFAYVADLQDLPKQAKEKLKKLDLLVIECNNGLENVINGHSNLTQVLAWVEELKPKKAILTHLSTKVDYAELSRNLPEKVKLAFDGLEIHL